jgi:Family of unknown function (DUF6496)
MLETRGEAALRPCKTDRGCIFSLPWPGSCKEIREEFMPAKKKSSSSRGKGKVKKVMHEYKHGQLKSGRSGKKVKSRKQAVAIALSEARQSGAKIPKKKSTRKKSK